MSHHCHFPNCEQRIEPKLWGCLKHWQMLPASLRNAIWRAYRPGQEIDKKPSAEYISIAKRAQTWIHANLGGEVKRLAALKERAQQQKALDLKGDPA